MERLLSLVCPCVFGGAEGQRKQLFEMSPVTGTGGDSKEFVETRPASSSWFQPITKFKEKLEADQERKQKVAVLQEGAVMALVGARSRSTVSLKLSSDGSMLMWQSLRQEANMPSESGVMSLSTIREVKPVLQSGLLRSGLPVPLQWVLISDEEDVKFEAESETVKEMWMNTLLECTKRQADAKAERKIGYQTKRRMGLEERRRDAERRKAELMKGCAGGMKHTAAAMMNR